MLLIELAEGPGIRGWIGVLYLERGNRLESGAHHPALRFGIFHEGIPDKTGARIFGHDHGDSRVDSDDVVIVPIRQRIEGVHKSVAAPGTVAVAVFHRAEHAHGRILQEWQRASRGAGHNRAIDRAG